MMFNNNRYLALVKKPFVGERIYIRMAQKQDYLQWHEVRQANFKFLQPFEPVWSKDALTKKTFYARVRHDRYSASKDEKYAFLIFDKHDDQLLGGINMNNVNRGVFQACALGYWLAKDMNSRGMMSEAVKIISNLSFSLFGLNRIQAATLVDNTASIRVLEKNGFEQEGLARRFLKINGQWQDHFLFSKITNQ